MSSIAIFITGHTEPINASTNGQLVFHETLGTHTPTPLVTHMILLGGLVGNIVFGIVHGAIAALDDFLFLQGVGRSIGFHWIFAGFPSQVSFFSTGIVEIDQSSGTVTTVFVVSIGIPAFHPVLAGATIEIFLVVILLGKAIRVFGFAPSRADFTVDDEASVGAQTPGVILSFLDAFRTHVTIPTPAVERVVFFAGHAGFSRFVDFSFAGADNVAIGVFD